MREKWVGHLPDLVTLACHYIHRVVQKDAADVPRCLGHKNLRAREAPHRHGQGADVVLMSVRKQNRFDLAIGDCFEIWKCVLPSGFWVHPAIKQEPVSANLNVVRIRPDFRVPCEINEFQMRLR